ncbi:MAG: radical SAM protein [Candidatus Omnitrophica bacterium]|nr:radical SAM protein [Candidatus Omnitrophota bacterium]
MRLLTKFFKKEKAPILHKEGKKIPSFCLLVVNKQCNFHCRMCNMWKHTEDPSSLTLDEMKQFVSDLRSFVDESIFIHLIGGETLLWPHTVELAKFITDTGFKTSITTNGYLIDERMAEQLVNSGMSGIFISLDSLDEVKHDFIRGMKGSYARVMKAIDNLSTYRARYYTDTSIGLTFTLMQHNIDEALDFTDWVQENKKIDSLFFNAVLQPFDSGEESKNWWQREKYKEIWPHDLDAVHHVIDKLIERKRNNGSKICNPPEQLRVLKEYFKDPYRFRHNMRIKCTRGDLAPEVNASGDISMCFYKEPLGNIRKDNIRDVWFSDAMVRAREHINQCDMECDLAANCFYKIENITDYVK